MKTYLKALGLSLFLVGQAFGEVPNVAPMGAAYNAAPKSALFGAAAGVGNSRQPTLWNRWGTQTKPAQLVKRDTKFLVVVTFGTICPLAKQMVPVIKQLQDQFRSAGVQFIALFPNANDTLPRIASVATEYDISSPIYLDDFENPWAKQLGLTATPEVALLDVREGYDPEKVIYTGAVDNASTAGGALKIPTELYLANAIEEAAAGGKVVLDETAPDGCPIIVKSGRRLYEKAEKEITYYDHIRPLFDAKCHRCHMAGEVAEAKYSAFEDADTIEVLFDEIKERVLLGEMPPFDAEIPNKEKFGGFKDDARLSDEQIKILLSWEAQGFPLGIEKPFTPTNWPRSRDWRIGNGEPDFVYTMPDPYTVAATRQDDYQYFTIPLNFKEDRWVKGFQLKPGNPRVVHHIAASVYPHSKEQKKGLAAAIDAYGLLNGIIRRMGDFVAGDPFNAHTWPEGQAAKIPAGHDLLLELHYTPTGKQENPDASMAGIVWADKAPEKEIFSRVFPFKDIKLRAQDGHYRIERPFSLDEEDIEIIALAPHMHYRGKSWELYKVTNEGKPNEVRDLVIRVPRWDFNWQRTYFLEKPLQLLAGERLIAVVHYDNSEYNPVNPNPFEFVKWGLQSWEEMFNMRFRYYRINQGDES